MLIQDNIILITGGGRGIGNFLAMHLALVAKKVIVFDKSPELIDQLHDIPNIEGICCDITDPEAVRDSVAEIFQKGYMVDVCINN
ncbi:SDR family NAD(P)-dependent oxidoreductase, partial [Salmonella enterica]|uniref:SDR family NAD(P)-dependent oxidoreductase n=2 Tax=Enterobacteriaceae TaxID=543 RepID=UPI003D274AEB